jgi:alginate O-acetyltransferase complex protein AlgI
MVFTSHIFIFYLLPVSIALYYAMKGVRRLVVLTLMSYIFYSWTNPWFVLVLMWSTACDFICGNFIERHWKIGNGNWQRKAFLVISLCSNIGMLFFFKYYVFAAQNLNAIRSALGLEPARILNVILPIGISFYTFESISYIVDIYRGRAHSASVRAWNEATSAGVAIKGFWNAIKIESRALLNFACYISQFPHLVAGPIIRFQDLEPQFYHRIFSVDKFARGVFFVCMGMAKKVLIADTLSQPADYVFNSHPLFSSDAWFGLFAYAFQIYFDFSGYSDIAIGLGLIFGFEFAKNFDSPYKAGSLTEFWRRWHISLSNWLRDYLYIELGGNRKGQLRTYINLIVVMLLGGFWHGAAWTFLAWGGIHGAWLAFERRLGKQSFYATAPKFVRIAITFLIVCLAWVFFRSSDFGSAARYLKCMFGFAKPPAMTQALIHMIRDPLWSPVNIGCLITAAAIAFWGIQTWDLAIRLKPLRAAFALIIFMASLTVLSVRDYSPFLYFRF